jgi:hypothetical protein
MTVLRYIAPVASLLVMSAAQAETYADCEKYDAPLAYNQCLASHGPSAAHALAAKTEEGEGADFHAPPAVRSFHAVHSFRRFYGVRRGRMSATFAVQDAHPTYQGGNFRRGR